jgi:hypothetical protein
MTPDRGRFFRIFALAVLPLAAIMAAWTMFQAALDPSASQHGHRVWSSLVRATAPAASGSALLLAVVLGVFPARPADLPGRLRRVVAGAGMAALPGYLLSAGVALLAGLAVTAARGAPERLSVSPWDLAVGAFFAALDALLVLALAWRLLPRLAQARLSLPAQLGLALAVSVPLRATAALLGASLLSA